ncbi:uncharacterized protein LOC133179584 [Saccostrea echinata]|uniref:uncharacterized protein LOC133179584 n=1 Tax=Saccostrea echinata TaxID=191078 RepID=UPI002A829A6A|nr:uncharacterized protein LOC133179584 [Saccostrea echinata]
MAPLASLELQISQTAWLRGPDFFRSIKVDDVNEHFPLIDAEIDKEIKKEMLARKTCASQVIDDTNLLESTVILIIKEAQLETYGAEIKAIRNGSDPPKNSPLLPLNPILGVDGLLRVGGRIRSKQAKPGGDQHSAHPIIIPKSHHVAVLIIRHYHSKIHHQGRQMTEGAIRSFGYWIVNGKRMISSEIHHCVACRKLRGKIGWVQMVDLPEDRLQEAPPFTFVGLDVFGPCISPSQEEAQ